MDRVILHCDLNSFYASVELPSYPELREKAVAVCGDPTQRHGIILAKNEAAKRFGVKTAETIYQAKKKCPELILLPPHHERYAHFSRLVNDIYAQYTDLVEPFGIDESWLDITHTLHLFGGDARALADNIRERVKAELGLTLSVGVSFNKVFAKLGSDYKKPDATTVISRENWREMLAPLPVGDLLYVGHAAAELLARHGITTIGELAMCSEELLTTLLGKQGAMLHRYANGLDSDPVLGESQRPAVKSVGNSTTFQKDLTTREEVRTGVALLADSVAMRLRAANLYCGGVQVGIRNSRFQNISRQKLLPHSTHLLREITDAALELVESAWKAPDPIRLLSVTAIHLTSARETYEQLDLLHSGGSSEKQEAVEDAMAKIRGKFGKNVISYGRSDKKIGTLRED